MSKRENKPDKPLELTFSSTIAMYGGKRRVITIPIKYFKDIDAYVGEDLIVTIHSIQDYAKKAQKP